MRWLLGTALTHTVLASAVMLDRSAVTVTTGLVLRCSRARWERWVVCMQLSLKHQSAALGTRLLLHTCLETGELGLQLWVLLLLVGD